MTLRQTLSWIAVAFGTAVMYRRVGRRVDVLDAQVDRARERSERADNDARRVDRARKRAAAMQMLLQVQFEQVLPILLSRLVGTAGPGAELLGESLLMNFLESLTAEQLKSMVAPLNDTQRMAIFNLYDLYRSKWKKDHSEEETESAEQRDGASEASPAEGPEPGAEASSAPQ